MFNRDVSCYRAAPRRLSESKFGPYAQLSVIDKEELMHERRILSCVTALLAATALFCFTLAATAVISLVLK